MRSFIFYFGFLCYYYHRYMQCSHFTATLIYVAYFKLHGLFCYNYVIHALSYGHMNHTFGVVKGLDLIMMKVMSCDNKYIPYDV